MISVTLIAVVIVISCISTQNSKAPSYQTVRLNTCVTAGDGDTWLSATVRYNSGEAQIHVSDPWNYWLKYNIAKDMM